jgi:hypothetical protein
LTQPLVPYTTIGGACPQPFAQSWVYLNTRGLASSKLSGPPSPEKRVLEKKRKKMKKGKRFVPAAVTWNPRLRSAAPPFDSRRLGRCRLLRDQGEGVVAPSTAAGNL